MDDVPLRIEHYATRIVRLVLAGTCVYFAVVTRDVVFALLAGVFLILAVRTREYRDEWRWWLAVAAFTGVTLWWTLQFLHVRDLVGRRHPATVIYLVGVACMGADVLILVLGRVRGVWRFQQPK